MAYFSHQNDKMSLNYLSVARELIIPGGINLENPVTTTLTPHDGDIAYDKVTGILYIGFNGTWHVAPGGSSNCNVTVGCNLLMTDSIDSDHGTVGTQTRNFQAGIYGAGPIVAGLSVLVNSSGQLGTNPSALKYKDDIENMNDESLFIYELRPVTFTYKSDTTFTKQFGLIANEMEKVESSFVVKDENGEIEGIKYIELISPLLNEVIKQKGIIDKQNQIIFDMNIRLEKLES